MDRDELWSTQDDEWGTTWIEVRGPAEVSLGGYWVAAADANIDDGCAADQSGEPKVQYAQGECPPAPKIS